MKLQEFETLSNNRIRSFLSPYSKYGTRSLSTSQSHPTLDNSSFQNKKSYIDFRRVERKKDNKPNIRIKIQDFSKNEFKKDQRLLKCTMNKFKENNQKWEKYQQTGELVKIVRELKQKIIDLEAENIMLRKKQQEDGAKIFKQNDIIRNLEEAIHLNRSRASYSLTLYQKQRKNCEQLQVKKEFMTDPQSYQQKFARSKKGSRDIKLQKFSSNVGEREKKKQLQICKSSISQKQKNETSSKLQVKELQYFLRQIQKSKIKQLQEIDSLLADFDV